jgi:spore coat protein U-like protein
MTRNVLALAMGIALALTTAPAGAITACSFGTVVGVAFGSYDVFSASPTDSTGSLTFSCEGAGANETIVIELGKGVSGSYSPRQLRRGIAPLEYNLYTSGARSTVWGDGTSGTARYGPVLPPVGSSATVTVYGRVRARQNVAGGAYSDTIVATILF